jgi:integrase/recombinase XerD
MNPKELTSRQFIDLEDGFLSWLRTLGYSEATITTRKRNLSEFLLYLERCGISSMDQAAGEKTKLFVMYLKRRENRLYGSGLMNASINVSIGSVNKFFEYLRQSGNVTMVPDNLQYVEELYGPRVVLTPDDISSLYEATYIKKWFARAETKEYQAAIQQRDRAMLGIYYGCGLRKSEGTNLITSDILTERKLIYVRKGKGCKERYVPVTDSNLSYITEYLQDGRNFLLARNQSGTESFFINQFGGSCSDQALSARLDRLVKNSNSSGLQKKKPTLHTLRHSIATHLLQSGMEIEMIQKFLGHASLESTQIYTHLANEL